MCPGRGRPAGPTEEGHAIGGGLLLWKLRLLLGLELLVNDDLDVVLRKGGEEKEMSKKSEELEFNLVSHVW